MILKTPLLASMLSILAAFCLVADEPTKVSPIAEGDELTTAAQAVVDELRSVLAKDSEGTAMLDDILNGSRLGQGEGWFRLAVTQTRFDWHAIRARYDTNNDDSISAAEFSADKVDFSRVDVNGDENINEVDFDWSKSSLSPTAGFVMFFMADRDGNGKVTAEEFTQLFAKLDAGKRGFLALDDLRDEFQPPPANAKDNRPDRPSRSTLIMGLKRQDIGSLQPGPSVNDRAPDFTLTTLQGEMVTLSQEIGEMPIVLVFGNFTCGPFRSQAGNIDNLYLRYRDRAKFYLVYVREAHPSDGWWMSSNQRVGIEVVQPNSNQERKQVAQTCQRLLDLEIPFLVDTVDDMVGAKYSGMPNRLYLIDKEGRVAFKNGRGPFGFHPRQLEQALILLLNSQPAGQPETM